MSRKKIILLVFLLLLAFVGWYAYKEYNRTNKDLSKTRADINITATELIAEFAAADSLAGKKYNTGNKDQQLKRASNLSHNLKFRGFEICF